jgi:Cdc6-like AAA superfamily ATPase
MSGDVRLLLSTFSRAIDASANAKQASVTPVHILQAIQKDKASASSSSSHIQVIRGMGLQGRLVLCTLMLALRRASANLSITPSASPNKKKPPKTSTSNFSHVSLHSYYTSLLRTSPITALSRVDFSDVLSSLEVNGLILISLSQARGEKSRSSISLVSGVQESELLRGLFGDESKKQDEVKEIWGTESSRITKLVAQRSDIPQDLFAEASQR